MAAVYRKRAGWDARMGRQDVYYSRSQNRWVPRPDSLAQRVIETKAKQEASR